MIVDDEEDKLRIIQRALEKYGFKVLALADSVKALDSFMSAPGSFVLVITDIRMPGMNGLELSEKIWSVRPEMKVLFMTTYLAEEMNAKNRALHKRDIIQKPFTIQRICDEVKLRLPATS
ncbi:MAG TPA: response regulator [Nitrososphaera sp.]|jgi:DNA-binding NtrC family response regulator|nr:response regulator [Nitrososphaera sp.]